MTISVPALLAVVVLVGCGPRQEGMTVGSESAASTTVPAAQAPLPGAAIEPRQIAITADDQMRFSIARIEAAPGENLKVTLTNLGTLPKTVMGHNWVLLRQGVNPLQFSAAAVGSPDFIPMALSSQIVAHTRLLGPGESDTVEFSAPTEPGEYPFLCSFTGHAATMKGVLVVQ